MKKSKCKKVKYRNSIEVIRKDGLLVTLRKGTNDEQVLQDVLYSPLYCLDNIKLRKHSVIYDIGAHIGIFTLKAKSYFPLSKIYCFEPEEENYQLLRENLRLCEGIIFLYRNAVVGNDKPNGYYMCDIEKPASISYSYGKGKAEVPYIQWETIQDWEERIDLLKLDCEGGERYFIEKIDWSKIGYLIAEIHLQYRKQRKWFLSWYESWKKDVYILYERIGKHLHISAEINNKGGRE